MDIENFALWRLIQFGVIHLRRPLRWGWGVRKGVSSVPHPFLVFNNANFPSTCKSQTHLGIFLDSKLTFEEH